MVLRNGKRNPRPQFEGCRFCVYVSDGNNKDWLFHSWCDPFDGPIATHREVIPEQYQGILRALEAATEFWRSRAVLDRGNNIVPLRRPEGEVE